MAVPIAITGPIPVTVVVGDRRRDIGRVDGHRRRSVNRPVDDGSRKDAVTMRVEPVTIPIAKAIKAVMVAVPPVPTPLCLGR